MSKKTLFGIIGVILLFAVFLFIAIGSSWFTNGDFKTWHNNWFQGTETPEEDSKATAGIHTHALSASVEKADDNAGIELYSSIPSKCPFCGNSIYQESDTATCQSDGYVTYRCIDQEECGWGQDYPSSRNPNNHCCNWVVTTSATCTSQGVESYKCSLCSTVTDTRSIPTTAHNYSWVITTTPVGDSAGVESYICSNCSNVTQTRTVYALPDDPEKEGYHFVGWYLDEALTQAYDNRPIYEDTQLYAKFEINVYTVTFDSAGGNDIESVTVNWNTVITPAEPEKTGYNFLGWYLDDDTEYDGQAVKENTTLMARWEIKRFTVLFYVEGELYTTVTVDYGTSLGAVADVEEVFLNNIVSFANVNSDTPETSADKMTVSDDMIVVANKPSTFEKIWKYKYTPYIIGGVCAIVALGVAVTVIEKKKKQV